MSLTAVAGCAVCMVLAAANAALPLNPPRHGGVYVIAHRGAHEAIPENTLPAYKKAIELGADFVEIDTRTTKDDAIVSVHNDKIDGYAKDVKGPVASFTLEQLRALDVGSRIAPEWKDARIPTFEEILDACKGRIGIYLDLKAASIPELVKFIQARGMEHDIVWYTGQVSELYKACPECIEMPDPGPETLLAKLLDGAKPRIVASSWKYCSKTFVEKCHAAGALVFTDDGGPKSWKPLLEWGVDGIQTDRPADLIRLLDKHGKTP